MLVNTFVNKIDSSLFITQLTRVTQTPMESALQANLKNLPPLLSLKPYICSTFLFIAQQAVTLQLMVV